MASDELKLLDGVQRYGLGNWDDMSVQVFNRLKTAKYVCMLSSRNYCKTRMCYS